ADPFGPALLGKQCLDVLLGQPQLQPFVLQAGERAAGHRERRHAEMRGLAHLRKLERRSTHPLQLRGHRDSSPSRSAILRRPLMIRTISADGSSTLSPSPTAPGESEEVRQYGPQSAPK